MQIRYEILKLAAEQGGISKTHLLYTAMISWKALTEELSALDKLQLLQQSEDMDKKLYLTPKGNEFVDRYEKLMSVFDTRKLQ